jgi:glutathione S-transferase
MPTLYCLAERKQTEQIRFIFAETGIKYEEKVVTEREAEKLQEDGKLIFNQLPMLEWDGFYLCEPAAIVEHIAVKADEANVGRNNSYLGADESERSYARALTTGANEFRRQMYEQFLAGPKQDKDAFLSTTLPAWLSHLNRLAVTTETNDFGLGPSVSYTFGDIAMFEALNQLHDIVGADVLDGYRELKQYYAKVSARPRFRMYLDNRN